MLGAIDSTGRYEPPARLEDRPARDAGRPGLAEDAALVAQRVCQARLVEQLVIARTRGVRDVVADSSDEVGRRADRRRGAAKCTPHPDRREQRARLFERVGLADAVSVEQSVADRLEISRDGAAGSPRKGAQIGEHVFRIVSR